MWFTIYTKRKAFVPAGVAIVENLSALHGAVRCEELLEWGAMDFVAQVSNINLAAHQDLLNLGIGPAFYFPGHQKEADNSAPAADTRRGSET